MKKKALAILFSGIFVLLLITSYGFAQTTLSAEHLTDRANVVKNPTAVETELLRLAAEQGVDLFVLYVDQLGTDLADFSEQVAQHNGLGNNDVLLVIDSGRRMYQWRVEDSFRLSTDTMNRIAASALEPSLRENNWDQAIIDTARALGTSLSKPQSRPQNWLAVIIVIALAASGLIIWRRLKKPAAEPEPVYTLSELEKQAGAALVEVDDAIATSRQELGYAEAEFGPEQLSVYQKTVEDARKRLDQAFLLQQSLYDADPETEAEKRKILEEILALTKIADELLDEKALDFKKLRDLANHVEKALTDALAVRQELLNDQPLMTSLLSDLKNTYRQSALGEVADDDEQARKLLNFEEKSIQEAKQQIANNNKQQAAIQVRAIEDANLQIQRLHDSIQGMKKSLEDTMRKLSEMISYVNELSRSSAMQDPAFVTELAAAKSLAELISTQMHNDAIDPFERYRELSDKVNGLEQVYKQTTKQLGSRKQAMEMFELLNERAAQVESMILTRRGGIGSSARAALQAGKQKLSEAVELLDNSPEEALQIMKTSRQYLERAAAMAQSDVGRYNPQNSSYGGSLGDVLAGLSGAILSDVIRPNPYGRRQTGGVIGGLGKFLSAGFGGTSRGGFGGVTRTRGRSGGGRF